MTYRQKEDLSVLCQCLGLWSYQPQQNRINRPYTSYPNLIHEPQGIRILTAGVSRLEADASKSDLAMLCVVRVALCSWNLTTW